MCDKVAFWPFEKGSRRSYGFIHYNFYFSSRASYLLDLIALCWGAGFKSGFVYILFPKLFTKPSASLIRSAGLNQGGYGFC